MTHACERCGTPVEDGVSFCPNCAAPQIRVTGFEPAVASDAAPGLAIPSLPGELDWRRVLPAAAIAGIGSAFLCMITAPLLKAGLVVWMFLAGVFCVQLYRRRAQLRPLSNAAGGRLGAMAGLFGFLAFALVQSLVLLAAQGAELRDALRQRIEQAVAQNPDPQAQEMMRRFATPEGLAVLMTLTMVFLLVGFVVLGSVGGAFAAARSRRTGPKP